MADVVLFGTGQIAEVARAYLDWEGSHRIAAHTVHRDYLAGDYLAGDYLDGDDLTGGTKNGLPVVAWEDLEARYPPGQVRLFAPIGYGRVNAARKAVFEEGLARGYDFVSFIHPAAHYYGTPVGRNVFVMEANVIQPHVTIGDNCILWSGNHIGHHTAIGDHCFLASHVVVSGSVTVGERCFLGVNATVRDNVTLGPECVVGAGALVTRDLPARAVVPGPKSEVARITSDRLRGI